MPDRAFVDTNVLLYLLSDIPAKADRANELVQTGGVISVQVLNEFANAARRKFSAAWPLIRIGLNALYEAFEIAPVDLPTHHLGMQIAERHRYSLYDSLLLAAALEAGCDTFWSEDLHEGQVIEGRLTIRNPFR